MQVILVNNNDEQVGVADKLVAHSGDGILHRAFTILLFNNRGEVLLQQRSQQKLLWPLFWEATCSSHQAPGENDLLAAQNRLQMEMGIETDLQYVAKFQYQAQYADNLAENELCYLYVGEYNGNINPNQKEVANFQWIAVSSLKKALAENNSSFCPWLAISFRFLDLGGERS